MLDSRFGVLRKPTIVGAQPIARAGGAPAAEDGLPFWPYSLTLTRLRSLPRIPTRSGI